MKSGVYSTFLMSEGSTNPADIIGSVSISLCLLTLGYNSMGQVIMSFILGCKQVRHSGKRKERKIPVTVM